MRANILKGALLSGAFLCCGLNQEVKASPKSIVAVEPITCELVNAIAPPSLPVVCLISKDQDVHKFKITPKQLQELNSASQIITLGQEMTPAIKSWLQRPLTVVVGVSAIGAGKEAHREHKTHEVEHSSEEDRNHHDEHLENENEDGHHHHLHGGLDPHIWHDPRNTKKMADLIYAELKQDIPAGERKNRKVLRERYKNVKSILSDLNQWNKKQVASLSASDRWIVSKHKAMEYFADSYGFKTLSLLNYLGHSGSLRPQAMNIAIRELKKSDVPVLFSEQEPPSKVIRSLSQRSNIPIAPEPIYVDGIAPKENTISTAVKNTCNIVNSLGGSCDQRTGQSLKARWDSLIR